jgi:hypothetical protein
VPDATLNTMTPTETPLDSQQPQQVQQDEARSSTSDTLPPTDSGEVSNPPQQVRAFGDFEDERFNSLLTDLSSTAPYTTSQQHIAFLSRLIEVHQRTHEAAVTACADRSLCAELSLNTGVPVRFIRQYMLTTAARAVESIHGTAMAIEQIKAFEAAKQQQGSLIAPAPSGLNFTNPQGQGPKGVKVRRG